MTTKEQKKATKILNAAAPIYGAILASTDVLAFDPSKEDDKRKAAALLTNTADLSIAAARALIKGVGISIERERPVDPDQSELPLSD